MNPDSIRGYLFDAVGIAFTGAAIYMGVTRGVVTPEFEVFISLSAAYLGLKAPVLPPVQPPR